MLKTTRSTGSAANSKKTESEVGGNNVVGDSMVGGDEATNPTKGKNQAKTTKSKILIKSKNHDFPKSKTEKAGMGFFTPEARLAFTQLRQAFVENPIFYHFDPESHIQIKTDALSYAIGGVLNQLFFETRPDGVVTKADCQWHPVAFFFRMMISAKTWYKIHNGKLLAIVKAFKTWRHYLEGCKYEVLVFIDYNNLRCFMDTKNLSSKQVRWVQKLFCYHFCINYWQSKVNGAADALSQYPQQNAKEKATVWAKNTKILHRMQSSLANISGLFLDVSSPFHPILICGTTVLLQLQ